MGRDYKHSAVHAQRVRCGGQEREAFEFEIPRGVEGLSGKKKHKVCVEAVKMRLIQFNAVT